jgi:hypothetical protein
LSHNFGFGYGFEAMGIRVKAYDMIDIIWVKEYKKRDPEIQATI